MAEIRIDPPRKKRGGFLSDVGHLAQFVASPLRTIVGAANDSHSRTNESKEIYGTLPLIVDTDNATVRFVPMPAAKGRAAYVVDQRNANAADAARLLQQVYYTGEVPNNLPPGYRAAANIVAQLHETDPPEYLQRAVDANAAYVADKAANVQTGTRNNPPFPVWESDNMGILIPPGGMAGFAQMTGASKLALTRGSRGRSTGTRRKRRKTKKTATRKRTKRRASGKRKLVKGSAAAKKYMASIRRKRRK